MITIVVFYDTELFEALGFYLGDGLEMAACTVVTVGGKRLHDHCSFISLSCMSLCAIEKVLV